MSTLQDEINGRIDSLDILFSRLEESISNKPQGHLIVANERGNIRYYQSIKARHRIYLNRSQRELIRNLAQKEYEKRLLKAAKMEKDALLELKEKLQAIDVFLESTDNSIRSLANPDVSTDDGQARLWASESYYRAKRTDSHIFETIDKNIVRSKSEVLIADRLHIAGIPYRYEQLLVLDDGFEPHRYYPDFTILNKRTRQVFYWEHFGRLGDEEYCSQNLDKLDVYARNGIIQGKNLILTYECSGKPISTSLVDQLIEAFLK